ncbi:hypothetical protein BKA65DRAFT_471879 [Rhexocercosporidium sp. MPI-PUGE-AT-0058]|nr:hypothetical protein BKA65DRAFT_471879 [Rhexocercosporidium sp. MPI-PUGE-AT-0058]
MDPATESSTSSSASEDSLLQVCHNNPPSHNPVGTTNAPPDERKILFGTADAAMKFIREKIRAVRQAQYQISVAWFECEDHVYATAADKIEELERISIVETERIDDFQNRLKILRVSRAAQFRNEPVPRPTAFDFRPVAESMHSAAEKWIAKIMLKRRKIRGTSSRKNIIMVDGSVKMVSGGGWTNDTYEESWEDLGFERHEAKVTWAEQCYMESCDQKTSRGKHRCYKQSLLRHSLTVGDQ